MSFSDRPVQVLPVLLAISVVLGTEIASAGIIVTVGSAVASQGQGVAIDIFAQSDLVGGEVLEVFNAEFQVVPDPGVASVFNIASIPDISGTSNYVFAGTSSGFLGTIVGPPFDTAIVGDFGYALLDATPKRLARLELSPGPGFLAPTAGDRFRMDLRPGSGDSRGLVDATSNTGFLRFDFDLDFNLISEPVAFESSSGSVLVASQVVPEPASFVYWTLGMICLCWSRIRSRERRWGRIDATV